MKNVTEIKNSMKKLADLKDEIISLRVSLKYLE